MATGTELEQAKLEMKEQPDHGYADLSFLAYCARHGVLVGALGWSPDDDDLRSGVMHLQLTDQPAFVGVKSERFDGKGHAIYWDGKQVWDPNPESPDGRALSSYCVEFWWPLIRSAEAARFVALAISG